MKRMQWSVAAGTTFLWVGLGMSLLVSSMGCQPEEKPAGGEAGVEKTADEGQENATDGDGHDEEGHDQEKDAGQEKEVAKTSTAPTSNPVVVAGDWAQWGGNSLRNNVPMVREFPSNGRSEILTVRRGNGIPVLP